MAVHIKVRHFLRLTEALKCGLRLNKFHKLLIRIYWLNNFAAFVLHTVQPHCSVRPQKPTLTAALKFWRCNGLRNVHLLV